jgi:hypothetical protein
MKKSVFLLLTFILSTLVAHAGNMFGPGAFRNGSPLVTGVDGTYQATARAQNVTGIFRFAYSGGSQTTTDSQNSWTFFVNGRIARGSVVSNINESKIDGILDRTASQSTTTNTNTSQITLPYVQIFASSDSASGSFSGKLQLKNPSGAFSGSGTLLASPASTNNILGITPDVEILYSRNPAPPPQFVATGSVVKGLIATNYSVATPGSSIQNVNFKFRGVRTSATSSSGSGNSTASN